MSGAAEASSQPASAEVTLPAPDPSAGAPNAGQAPDIAANPASAPSKPVDTAQTPAKRTAVSAAVNADQAALTGASQKAWSVLLAFNTSLGVGTFLAAQTTQAAYVNSTLTIEPAYVLTLPKNFR